MKPVALRQVRLIVPTSRALALTILLIPSLLHPPERLAFTGHAPSAPPSLRHLLHTARSHRTSCREDPAPSPPHYPPRQIRDDCVAEVDRRANTTTRSIVSCAPDGALARCPNEKDASEMREVSQSQHLHCQKNAPCGSA